MIFTDPHPGYFHRHHWPKFSRAQQNMLRFLKAKQTGKNRRRWVKWTHVMGKHVDKIFVD